MDYLKRFLAALFAFLASPPPREAPAPEPEPEAPPAPPQEPPAPSRLQRLLDAAVSFLGVDASPADRAKDEVGCVESFEEVFRAAFGHYITRSPRPLLSTYALLTVLKEHPDFEEIDGPEDGAIILSATGTGNGSMPGHVGVVKGDRILSNRSDTGLWSDYFTLKSWEARYHQKGGMRTRLFRIRGYN